MDFLPHHRPNSPAWETHIHLRLRVGEDDDIIACFSDLPQGKRASALKSALPSSEGVEPGFDPIQETA